jgi:hypothetical protein
MTLPQDLRLSVARQMHAQTVTNHAWGTLHDAAQSYWLEQADRLLTAVGADVPALGTFMAEDRPGTPAPAANVTVTKENYPHVCRAFRMIEEDNGGHLIGTVYPGEAVDLERFTVPAAWVKLLDSANLSLGALSDADIDTFTCGADHEVEALIAAGDQGLRNAHDLLCVWFNGWEEETRVTAPTIGSSGRSPLTTLLHDVRTVIAGDLHLLYESHCLLDAELGPRVDTLDAEVKPEADLLVGLIERLDAEIASQEAIISAIVGAPTVTRQ